MKKVETEKEKKGSGGCFLAGFSTYLFRRMFRGSRTHHCALRLMRRLGTAHCALYVTLCALVNNTRVWPSLLPLFLPPLSFLLDLTGSIFAQASDQTRLTASFPILLRAFHSTRFELNATRPRLRSAISSFSSPLLARPNLPRGRCRRVVSCLGMGFSIYICLCKYEERKIVDSNFRN